MEPSVDKPVFYVKPIDDSRLTNIRRGLLAVFFIAACFTIIQLYNRLHYRLLIPFQSPFALGAGEVQSLPPMVLDMAKLASKHGILQFSLSKGLRERDHGTTMAHSVEFLYPIKMISDSGNIFALVQEEMPAPGCRMDTLGDIVLYDCRIK